MRPISWLHISDIHICVRDEWSQDVVLKAMCNRISNLREQGISADFILATGDLAYSGKPEEYILVRDFFDAISDASGVLKERIFCVPGNHDIDRSRQKLSFNGARSSLNSEQLVDELLAPDEDLDTLLERERYYRQFQNEYFNNQERASTPDSLAYISHLEIDDIHFAIIGLDSAWAAAGGVSDHGKLLIGERQVINAISQAQSADNLPHIVICMTHHPCHLLREFDRYVVQARIEQGSQFFHCGHLHLPEARAVGQGATGCLVLAAGASFETRQSQNTFSVITMDLVAAKRFVKTLHYEPQIGVFSSGSDDEYEIEVASREICDIGELASELSTYCEGSHDYPTYLAGLLLDMKSEFPIPSQNGYVFGSFAVLKTQNSSALKEKAEQFMVFRNVLRAMYGRLSMQEVLSRHGAMITEYVTLLNELCDQDKTLKEQLAEQERQAQLLGNVEPVGSNTHTIKLLDSVAESRDWAELGIHASRHVHSTDTRLAIYSRRMLALSLAHGDTDAEKTHAIEIYRELCNLPDPAHTDLGNLAGLLLETGDEDGAKKLVILGIGNCTASQVDYFSRIGHKILESTGDRAFRHEMEDSLAKRGHRG